MAAVPRRLVGTPVFVNEAGAIIGADPTSVVPFAAAVAGKPTGTMDAPSGSLKRLPGTPCFVTASGAVVASPFSHPSGLKRLLGTPCFVTEDGVIVGNSHSVQANRSRPPSPAIGHSGFPRRLMGTPCFVTANGSITGPAARPLYPLSPRHLIGTPCVAQPSSTHQVASAVAVPVAALAPEAKASSYPTVTFSALSSDSFRFRVNSDKLETVIVLQSEESLTQWQCRADDAVMKTMAPAGVELPRSVVADFLSEALSARAGQKPSSAQVDLTNREGSMELTLSMDLGGKFFPKYTFPLTATEKQTSSLVAEMEAQIAELKRKILELSA